MQKPPSAPNPVSERRFWEYLLSVLVLGSIFFLTWSRLKLLGDMDPDRYYHLALARQMDGTAVIGKLPQVWGLGWQYFFPDKEFLFHVLTSFAHRLGQDAGVLFLIPMLTTAYALLLHRILCFSIRPLIALALVFTAFYLDPWFLMRSHQLRPHLMALLVFGLLLLSLIRNVRWLSFVSGALYALSYHAVYLPFLVLGCFLATGPLPRMGRIKLAVLGTLGLLTGTVLNPRFPGNVLMGARHLKIALFEAKAHSLNFGVELIPWPTDKMALRYISAFLLLILAPLVVILQERSRSWLRSSDLTWVWLTTLLFFSLAFLNPRALEYGIPCFLLLSAQVLRLFDGKIFKQGAVLAVILFSGAREIPKLKEKLKNPPRPHPASTALIAGLKQISVRDQLVFNCNWDSTPYLYYARPDLQFLDVLDPSLLLTARPDLHEIRETLRHGHVGDPYAMLKKFTPATLVLCRDPLTVSMLRADPHFIQHYPRSHKTSQDPGHFVFELTPKRDPHFVLYFHSQFFGVTSDNSKVAEASPLKVKRWVPFYPAIEPSLEAEVQPAFVNLRADLLARAGSQPPEGVACYAIRPTPGERARQKGKRVIGIGGGQDLRLWLNGRPLYQSGTSITAPRLIHQLIELERPLTANDRVEAVACSRTDSSLLGFALSFWNRDEIKKTCDTKTAGIAAPIAEFSYSGSWPRQGGLETTCLGPMARKVPE